MLMLDYIIVQIVMYKLANPSFRVIEIKRINLVIFITWDIF